LTKADFLKHTRALADPSTIDIAELVKQGLLFRKNLSPEYKQLQD
jgi:hypothetical protein